MAANDTQTTRRWGGEVVKDKFMKFRDDLEGIPPPQSQRYALTAKKNVCLPTTVDRRRGIIERVIDVIYTRFVIIFFSRKASGRSII